MLEIVKPSFTIEYLNGPWALAHIERAGRTCYKSEAKEDMEEARRSFVKKIIERGHLSVIEHAFASVRIICDRGVSHEIVRHRLASYSQESTRYCNYSKERFGNSITVIDPRGAFEMSETAFEIWKANCQDCANRYFVLLGMRQPAEMARSVLPNSLKTELVMTANLREWRHFFTLRTAKAAHPQMREITIPMLEWFQHHISVVFDDITPLK